jgi:DNA replicative helicase MCM subunit Mcm2 (Cdc46/Mcm family)
MRLSDVVEEQDMNAAIRMMLDSFISAQKHSVARHLRQVS